MTVGLVAYAPCVALLVLVAAESLSRWAKWVAGPAPPEAWALLFSTVVLASALATPAGPGIVAVPGARRADLVWLSPPALGTAWVASALAGRALERLARPRNP